jgi:hypothetical protein
MVNFGFLSKNYQLCGVMQQGKTQKIGFVSYQKILKYKTHVGGGTPKICARAESTIFACISRGRPG